MVKFDGPAMRGSGQTNLYRRLHVTYISEKLGHSDLVFRWWCGGNKRYLLVKSDGPAMRRSREMNTRPGLVDNMCGETLYLYRRSHVTYISEKVGHSDLVLRGDVGSIRGTCW